ncbi:hypothetical protein GcM3_004024, partial [Golovinomyces cichoracearum]
NGDLLTNPNTATRAPIQINKIATSKRTRKPTERNNNAKSVRTRKPEAATRAPLQINKNATSCVRLLPFKAYETHSICMARRNNGSNIKSERNHICFKERDSSLMENV